MKTKLSQGEISGVIENAAESIKLVFERGRKVGYEAGKRDAQEKFNQEFRFSVDCEVEGRLADEYNRGKADGRKEAWDLAEKISCMETDTLHDIFMDQYYDHCCEAFIKYTYEETEKAVADYEEQKQEIKVGDEVIYCRDKYIVVKAIDPHSIILWGGDYTQSADVPKLEKTGRHFDEVDKLLKAMQEG